MPESAANTANLSEGGLTLRAPPHDPGGAPLRRGRVGASRRDDRRPGEPRLRAARSRVPDHLVAERDQHRRPEVLPRPARLRRARELGQADDLPRRRDDRRLGPRAAATSPPTRTPTPSRPSSPTSFCTRRPPSTARSGSTSASRSTRSAPPASSSSVEDTMESILDWNTKEGTIFRGGSGSGINLSNIRGSVEHLSKGGLASGPVSFMRGADAWAGTIKSGGKTRRAAKMVVLDVDHPDIEDFIWCKANEEKKADGASRRRLRHVDRRRRLHLDPVPERQQLGPGHRRVHGGGRGRRRLGADRPQGRRGDEDAAGPRPAWARSPRRRGSAPIRASSTTRSSTAGTPAPSRGGSTPRTRARSTCTSTTRPATWPRST